MTETNPVYLFDGWRFDTGRIALTDPHGVETPLSINDAALLRTFCENPRQVVSRLRLLRDVHQREPTRNSNIRAVDVQICRMRGKLEANAAQPRIIRTVRDGYWFCPLPEIL